MATTGPHDDRENPPSDDWREGYDAAVREMDADAWTPDAARWFLEETRCVEDDRPDDHDFARGFNAAVRRLARP